MKVFENKIEIYDKFNNNLIAIANEINDLYFLDSYNVDFIRENENENYVNSIKLTKKERWHRALGHVNFDYLEQIIKNKTLDGLPIKLENEKMKCQRV